jgi:hypothetical protein
MSALPTCDPLVGAQYALEDEEDISTRELDSESDTESSSDSNTSDSSEDSTSDADDSNVVGDKRKRSRKSGGGDRRKARKTGKTKARAAPSKASKAKASKSAPTINPLAPTVHNGLPVTSAPAGETSGNGRSSSSAAKGSSVSKSTKSQYEIDRDANITRNKALFDSLDLRDTAMNVFKPPRPTPKRKDKPAPAASARETRAASRRSSCNNPTDEHADSESRGLELQLDNGLTGVSTDASVDAGTSSNLLTDTLSTAQNSTGVSMRVTTLSAGGVPPTNSSANGLSDASTPMHPTDLARPTVPSIAPDWFRLGFREVTGEELGPTFNQILLRFIEIESAAGFTDKKKGFPSSGRPCELGKWIGGGRWRRSAPPITNIGNFEKTWWKWWAGLQPEWREGRESGNLVRGIYGDKWDDMTVPGPNGWLSIIACLYWWGCATRQSSQGHEYEKALEDVLFMMDGLTQNLKKQSV